MQTIEPSFGSLSTNEKGGMLTVKAKAKRNTGANTAETQTDQATMVVTLYDGTRKPIKDKEFLIRIFDGFQNQLFDDFRPAPTTLFRLPFRDNLQDNCRVLASGDGYVDAGFTPVKLSLQAVAVVDLMLLQDGADFKFQTWKNVKTTDPAIAAFIAIGGSDAEAKAHYENLQQSKPAALASLPNLATAMKAIQLPGMSLILRSFRKGSLGMVLSSKLSIGPSLVELHGFGDICTVQHEASTGCPRTDTQVRE